MDRRELQRTMYELGGASTAQRVSLAVVVGAWTLLAWWMLAGAGLPMLGAWLGRNWRQGDAARRMCLAAGFSIYYVRILFAEFVFLKRGVSWSEVFTVAFWLFILVLFLSIVGGTNRAPFGVGTAGGVLLFVFGSWMNSYAEYARHVFKRQRGNEGRLYTEGLFRYTRHPNYLGDLLLFSGLCLMSGAWVTAIAPVLMLAGLVFINIPMLDAHLRDRYGSAFDEYARRTRKLVPFVY